MVDIVEIADTKIDDNRGALRRSTSPDGTATPSPQPSQQALIDDLCGQLSTYLDAGQVEDIRRTCLFSARAHMGQRRLSGEPYISHPLAVAKVLVEMYMDACTITAAILHDVMEDTDIAKGQIVEEFGEEVAQLVDGVSKLTHLAFASRLEAQAENFRKMMLAMVKDVRVIIIKLADRLHNMRTLDVMPPKKRNRIARETLDVYAPIALRLGMDSLRLELEELSLQALRPWRYGVLKEAMKRTYINRNVLLQQVKASLHEHLQRANVDGKVQGRQKDIYSVYRKMRKKQLQFSEVFDIFAFRIIVEDVDTCYRVLGVVHGLYKPVPGKFKDYIAIPKKNAYQSLHTVLFGPKGIPVEIQIRSREMDQVAQSGIAAHWKYKGGERDYATPRAREWFKTVSEIHRTGNSLEFLENVKIDLFREEIYVFTPTGDIMELPVNSTAVDFAYAVHSDIGNQCTAAKINRRPEPLSTVLTNGDIVEITTLPDGRPDPAWLNFIVTAKARSNLRNYLKNLQRNEARVLGARILDQALGVHGKTWRDVGKRERATLLKELRLSNTEELFQEIGLGNRVASFIARRLVNPKERWVRLRRKSDRKQPIAIKGTEGMIVHYGKCCHPIPGDSVIGVMTMGRGLVVHQVKCRNTKRKGLMGGGRHNWIHVHWADETNDEFTAQISIKSANERGVLAVTAARISAEGSNIENITFMDQYGATTTITVLLTVRNRNHLARIMRAIHNIPKIHKVKRV